MQRQDLVPRRLKPVHHHGAHTLEQLKSERMVALAVFPQNGPVEEDRGGWHKGPSSEVPEVRREHPRPAEQLTRSDRLDYHRLTATRFGFQRYLTALDQIKPIRDLFLAQNNLPFPEMRVDCAIRQ